MSSRSSSSSSGFSSITNEGFASTITLQTVLDIQKVDLNVRAIFCGEQDCRLNELRHTTGAIIDLHIIQGTCRPFERVNWTISHRNHGIRDFVLRRLNYWMQQTQIACHMAYEDSLFVREQEQQQQRVKSRLPPLSTVNFGRRYRTRSLTESDSIPYRSVCDSVPTTPSSYQRQQQQPFIGLLGRTLSYKYHDRTENIEMSETKINDLIESAKWAGVLSDTTDQELSENRVCFADTVSVSKLAEILRNNNLKPTSDLSLIETILQQTTINIRNREQIRQFNGQNYWFHRILLNDHIQFPIGISRDAYQARRLAYRNLIDVCLNDGGIKMKVLTRQRVKVVKGSKLIEQTNEFDMNATYISTHELSCLSHCNMVY